MKLDQQMVWSRYCAAARRARSGTPYAEVGRRLGLLFGQSLDSDIAEADGAMIALQHHGPWLIHFIVELATGGLVAFHVIMNLNPIQNGSDLIAHDSQLGSLPLTCWFCDKLVRCLKIINRSISL